MSLDLQCAVAERRSVVLAPEKGKDLQNKIDGAKDWLDQFATLLNTGRDVAVQ